MIKLMALVACGALFAVPSMAQDDEEEPAPQEETIEAPAQPAAPARAARPTFRPGARKASPSPASSGGGSGGGPGIMSNTDEVVGQSMGGAGVGTGDADDKPSSASPNGGAAGGGQTGGGDASVVDIGDLPTVGQFVERGGARPIIHLIGGKKWAIRLRHKGPGMGVFPTLIGGTNGDLTGNGKYTFKAAFSKSKGVVSGPGALCVVPMTNAAYVTCQQPCNMKWELRFGTPMKERKWKDLCELENDQIYYLNIEPTGNGCTGSPAQGYGCPIVMEMANGGPQILDP